MNKPDFLIIGAARSGTTAIHSYLQQCPELFLPQVKEPNFFAYEGQTLNVQGPGAEFVNNSVTDVEDYDALFAPAPDGALCGEASPLYLYEPKSAERIANHAPNARLIAILRNPIEQAWSHYLYASKLAVETEPDFTKALSLEESRLEQGWQPLFGYSKFPRYGAQLERFFEHFDREQIFIRLYEDFEGEPQKVISDMATHIGVTAPFVPDMSNRLNAGGVPKNRAFQDFLMRPNPITGAIGLIVPKSTRLKIRDWMAGFNVKKPLEMPKEARAILKDRLRADIEHTERLINRDLSHWLV